MRFTPTLVAAVGLLSAIPSAIATITINGPSPTSYWVQGTSNLISWTFNAGDPNPVSATVTNSNATILNGAFSIAENIDLSNRSFTVTNVTLRVATGYIVNFVNGSNATQVYAQSGIFSVMSPGTPSAPQATSSSSATSTSSASNISASVSASGASSSASNKPNSSLRSLDGSLMTLAPMLGMSVLMSVIGALATL